MLSGTGRRASAPLEPGSSGCRSYHEYASTRKALDEVHVMRKVVIDGSNTTGFQRTAVIALNGSITVEGVEVPIEQVTVEEDSGRKTCDTKTSVIFRIDLFVVILNEDSAG